MEIAFIFIFGLLVGSFLNVVICRLKTPLAIIQGRSHCPHCQQVLKWYELLPLVSFIIQAGKCRQCGRKISWQYPLVELATALCFTLSYWWAINYGAAPAGWWLKFPNWFLIVSLIKYFGAAAFLLVIFVYDLKHYLILDIVTVPAMIFALVINLSLNPSWAMLESLGFGILAGGGFFLFQYLVSQGKWIGGGDIRLGVVLGLLLGWPAVLVALALAYMAGALVGVALILTGQKKMSSQVPFGTFLAPAGFAALLWAGPILNYYLSVWR